MTLTETDEPTTPHLITGTTQSSDEGEQDRTEPDIDIYADMLLLTDTLEHHDSTAIDQWETPTLINLHTQLSDAYGTRGTSAQTSVRCFSAASTTTNPYHGRYGLVQRTTRRNRSLRDDDDVLRTLESQGIPRERVMGVDRKKVDGSIEVTELAESAVYDIDELTSFQTGTEVHE